MYVSKNNIHIIRTLELCLFTAYTEYSEPASETTESDGCSSDDLELERPYTKYSPEIYKTSHPASSECASSGNLDRQITSSPIVAQTHL